MLRSGQQNLKTFVPLTQEGDEDSGFDGEPYLDKESQIHKIVRKEIHEVRNEDYSLGSQDQQDCTNRSHNADTENQMFKHQAKPNSLHQKRCVSTNMFLGGPTLVYIGKYQRQGDNVPRSVICDFIITSLPASHENPCESRVNTIVNARKKERYAHSADTVARWNCVSRSPDPAPT